jgi:hypothetical protein
VTASDAGVRSGWFATAEWRDGGLWLPGRPTHGTADLLLRPDGAELRRGDAVCRLSWAAHARGDWAVTCQVVAGARRAGTAVEPPLPLSAEAAAVRARTRTLANLLRQLNGPRLQPIVIPLRPKSWPNRTDAAERGTLAALCTLSGTDTQARARLAEPETVTALIADLSVGALPAQEERGAIRRTTFEILSTLRRLGYRHRNGGRPLPGWTADTETVVGDVRRSLATNPYVRGLHFPEERVRTEVLREYVDVEPWPFAALTAPARARG